jgi:uncharacterized membrane protein
MNNDFYIKTGKLFFGVSVLAIGIIHIVNGNFPVGLMPVVASLPARPLFAYLTGILIIVAGALILTKKYEREGAILSGIIFLLSLILVDVPKIIINIKSPDWWTVVFEIFSFFSGALILAGIVSISKSFYNPRRKLWLTGSYIFAIALIIFGAQHYMYAQFIATLIPKWIPGSNIWPYIIMVAFIAAGLSIIIQKQVDLSAALLSLMFFLWVCIVHLPRVIANIKTEPEWTSMFVALAMSGIALFISGSATGLYKMKH